MSTPAKMLSPTELAKLEHAFATDPASEAYRPLAEAYLGMGRFMEAMVVCKKGVKAHPNMPDPRVLLARVYAEQGKDKKALEELAGALQVAPTDTAVLVMTANLQFKSGEAEAGKSTLLKAYDVNPSDAATSAAMTQWKVEPPKVAPPPPPEPIAPPRGTQGRGTPRPPTLNPADPGPAPVRRSNAGIPANGASGTQTAQRPSGTRRSPTQGGGVPAQRPSGSRAALRAYEEESSYPGYDDARPSHRQSARARSFFMLAGVLGAALLGYFIVGQLRAKRVREFNHSYSEALHALEDDSYDSYQKACKAAEQALEADGSSTAAQGVLAYAYTIRWGEHGGGDDAKRLAEEHLAAGRLTGELDIRLIAAESLLKSFAGQNAQALSDLDKRVKDFEGQGKAFALLYSTEGVLEMNAGDYEHARDHLERAQQLAPSDPRIYTELGTLYRRRGEDKLAWRQFDTAVRYNPNNPSGLLGKALIILDADNAAFFPEANHILKKLVDGQPPPSPRQLAEAHMAHALLIARVHAMASTLTPQGQKTLYDKTNVPSDEGSARSEVSRDESAAFTIDRNNPELNLLKAHRLVVEGKADAALEAVRAAIKMDATRPQYYVELARILMRMDGGAAEAQKALTNAIRAIGESPKLMVMLGQAYKMQNKLDDALAQFKRAVASPGVKNPEAHIGLGTVYLEKKDFPAAERELNTAIGELFTQNTRLAEVNTLLGRVYEGKGDRVAADAAYKRALNADADYADSYYFYAKFLSTTDRVKGRASALEYLKIMPTGAYAADAKELAK